MTQARHAQVHKEATDAGRSGAHHRVMLRAFVVLLSVALVASVGIPLGLVAYATPSFSWYTGHTPGDVYKLHTAGDVEAFAAIVNGTSTEPGCPQYSFEGETVQLESPVPIDMGGITLNSIGGGAYGYEFKGTFDGNGCTIKNFTVDTSAAVSDVGLFGSVGASGTVKNLTVTNETITIDGSATDSTGAAVEGTPDVVSGVGAIVGDCAGTIVGCTTGSDVAITITSGCAGTAEQPAAVSFVGGVAGICDMDMTGCTNAASITITANGEAYDVPDSERAYGYEDKIVNAIGGVVGRLGGDKSAILPGTHGNLSACSNHGTISIDTTKLLWDERWQEFYAATPGNVGGVVGFSMGNVDGCVNDVDIDIPKGSVIGGVVGSLRGRSVKDYYIEHGGAYPDLGMTEGADELVLSNCRNSGNITCDSQSAGIAGEAGTHVTTTKCSNTGNSTTWRWNKPSPAGIVAYNYGSISYCYNMGEVATKVKHDDGSVAYGGGFYSGGIAGMNMVYWANNEKQTPEPVIYACYNVGAIRANGEFRQGAITGLNEGIVKYCAFVVPGGVQNAADAAVGNGDEQAGTAFKNSSYSVVQMQSGLANAATLNVIAAGAENWQTFYVLPAEGVNKGYPVLNDDTSAIPSTQVSLAGAGVTGQKETNAIYSPVSEPAPVLTVKLNGVELKQNADYRVVPQTGAFEPSTGGAYTAQIVGIGNYKDTATVTVAYDIEKAAFGDASAPCSVSATPGTFNWEAQLPDNVTVYDPAGNVIPESEYSYVVNGGQDCIDYKPNGYPITVTASATSTHYTGSFTTSAKEQNFAIGRASMYKSPTSSQPGATFSKVVYDGVTYGWNGTVLTLEDGSEFDKNFTYTGESIKFVAQDLTYLGRPLVEGRDFRYIMNSINPETSSTDGKNPSLYVTGDKTAVCVIRFFNPGCNFRNWVNIGFNIVPADLATANADDGDLTISAIPTQYADGKAKTPAITVTGKTGVVLPADDYTVSYDHNTAAGTAHFTVTPRERTITNTDGSSYKVTNLSGSYSGTFDIVDASKLTDLKDAVVTGVETTYKETGSAICPKPQVTDASGNPLVENVDYTVSYSHNVARGTASMVITAVPTSTKLTGTKTVHFDIIGGNVINLAGDNRYVTAAKEALHAYPGGAGGVVIASGVNFPDALTGTGLAGALDYPILLSEAGTLPAPTAAALADLGITSGSKIIVLGGDSAVGSGVYDRLASLVGSRNITRLAGSSRFETADAIYGYGIDKGLWNEPTALIASGNNFPDALSISALAAAEGLPIFLCDGGVLPQTAKNNITSFAPDRIIAVGGTSAVAKETFTWAGTVVSDPVRLAGDSRYSSSLAIAEYCTSKGLLSWDYVGYASGQNFPDALAGSVVQGKDASVLLLADEDTVDALAAHRSEIGTIKFFGGESAVSADLRGSALTALRWN